MAQVSNSSIVISSVGGWSYLYLRAYIMSRWIEKQKGIPQAEPMGVFQTRVHLNFSDYFPTALVHY